MAKSKQAIIEKYVPMSETAFYMLLSLNKERHGYGIMQYVQKLTSQRLKIGPGTIYGTLSKMEADGLIESVDQIDRRKIYKQTPLGAMVLLLEFERLEKMVADSRKAGLQNER